MSSSGSGIKKYECDEGENQGHFKQSDSSVVKELQPRVKKGKSYVQEYLAAEEVTLSNTAKLDNESTGLDDIETASVDEDSNVHDLLTEKLYEIKKEFYGKKRESNSNLIINDFKQEILSLIEANEVVVLTGPTGCGKTTQVPQYLLDSSMENLKYCNIVVTQPRRLAAISVAKRVCDEREWEIGRLCGYKVGLKDRTSPQTLLTFMTTGVLLQTLIKKKSLNHLTHIILDEIHERDQSMDFLLIVIKKLINQVSNNTKIILMSATVEAQKFANYFQIGRKGEMVPAPIITIDRETNYKVDVYYLDDLSDLGDIPLVKFSDTRISEGSYDICIKLIEQFESTSNDEEDKSSVLIFLPGIFEIEHLYFKLKDPKTYSSGKYLYKWSPLPLHSSITIEEQAEIFRPPKPGYRKIILSTNIAESSITVPGVKYVIDFCLMKRLKSDCTTNFNALHLCWASQANCIQRAGRVGRVMDGKVYRMISEKLFKTLSKESKPEMLDAPLDRILLQTKILDMGEPKALLALALDPPDLSDIEWTILILKETGGLLRYRNKVYTPFDGDLTFLGRLMAALPVDIHITKLIALGHVFGCLNDCIVIGASMSVKNAFSHPFIDRLKAYDFKCSWAENSFSDCIALLNVYKLWRQHHEGGYFKRSKEDSEAKWAKRNFVQLRVLKEINLLVEEIKIRLKEYQIEEPPGYIDKMLNDSERTLILKVVIAGAFYPNYFGPGYKNGNTCEEEAVRELGGQNPYTTVMIQGFPYDQPMELYFGVIKNYFKDLQAEMKLHAHSNSKILIEFRQRQLKMGPGRNENFDALPPCRIPNDVYRILKTRHTRKSFDIKLLPVPEARKRAQSLGIRSWNEKFTKKRIKIEDFIPCPLPGIDVTFLNIKISYVIDAGHFWAMYADRVPNMKKILDIITKHSSTFKPFEKTPAPGTMCIAPFRKGTETYFYRARIECIRGDSPPSAEVFFVDHGSHKKIKVSNLKQYGPELAADLREIPGQVFECVLSQVRPSSLMNLKGEWTKAAISVFNTIIQRGRLVALVYSVARSVVSIELRVIDIRNNEINVNKFLVNEKYAEKANESYFSEMNHRLRSEKISSVDRRIFCNYLQEGEFWLPDDGPQLNDDSELTEDVQLRGPKSPLEMTLYPYTRGSLSKSVVICEDSVNSILLNTDPADRHERLIIAGSITQNSDGFRLLINHTTVMPNIHGLPALIPFIFSPEAELRTNQKRTKYTGLLCGLGADEMGRSLFPEHDMELYFDTEITFEDFKMVNALRYHMSVILLNNEYESYPIYSTIKKYQHKIRKIALKLLTKNRKSCEIDWGKEAHDWRRTEPDLLVTTKRLKAFNEICTYPIHPGISLVSRWA